MFRDRSGGSKRRGPWLFVLPALMVFLVTVGYRWLSPVGEWRRFAPKDQSFSLEMPGMPFLSRQIYEAAGLGQVQQTRWALKVGKGVDRTEYIALRLQLENGTPRLSEQQKILDSTLASASSGSSAVPYGFSDAQLGALPARQLQVSMPGSRRLSARAVFFEGSIFILAVDEPREGRGRVANPELSGMRGFMHSRRGDNLPETIPFTPDPERFLDSLTFESERAPGAAAKPDSDFFREAHSHQPRPR